MSYMKIRKGNTNNKKKNMFSMSIKYFFKAKLVGFIWNIANQWCKSGLVICTSL